MSTSRALTRLARCARLRPTLASALSPAPFPSRSVAAPLSAASAPVRFYDSKVIDHFENPRNVGSFDKSDPSVGTGLVGAPACGDVMKLQIRVDEKTGEILESRFKTFGCGSAIASSSLATEMIKGRNIDEAIKIRNKDIASELKLPPVKLHCSMLAEDAIKAAVRDFQSKKALRDAAGVESQTVKAADSVAV